MANGSNGRGGNSVVRSALVVAAAMVTACATTSPTEPRTAGMDKWDGEPVVEHQQSCAAGQTGPACAPIRAAAP